MAAAITGAVVIGIFQGGTPVSGQTAWANYARHANMARYYQEAHKPPPTLVEIKQAAERGDAKSQYDLAEIYNSKCDYDNALNWNRKSAEQDYTNAQYALGEALLNGRPQTATSPIRILPDTAEALIWLGHAANQSHPKAQFLLAGCYENGVGVNQDLLEAFKWYALAAKQSNSLARAAVERLTLKLKSEEVVAVQLQVDAFVPSKDASLPEPAYLDQLKLKGISGSRSNRLAIINNRTLGANEETDVKLDHRFVPVRCLEIRDKSVVLQVGPFRKELLLPD